MSMIQLGVLGPCILKSFLCTLFMYALQESATAVMASISAGSAAPVVRANVHCVL